MLEDYRDQLKGPVDEGTARTMMAILFRANLKALKVLPRMPETQRARDILDIGGIMALYQKVKNDMTIGDFLVDVMRIRDEVSEQDT